jgi:hypothetical protein
MTRPDGFAVPHDDPRKGNCGLTALAIVSGKSFSEVRSEYLRCYPKSYRWGGATRHAERMELLAIWGVPHSEVNPPRRMQFRTWFRRFAKPGTTYMLRHNGHVCVFRDGWVIDQSGPKTADNYRWRKAIITNVVEVRREA